MASVYTNDLRLEEIGSGEQSGTWGDTTNTNLELIAEAFSFGTEAITTNADTHATTIADGATDAGRSMFLKYTGTLDSACTITIGPNTVSKLWFIENGTSGSQNIIIKQGSGATITIPAGQTKAIYSNGAGSGGAMVDAFATLNVVDLLVDDDLTVTDDVDIGGALTMSGGGDGAVSFSTASSIKILDNNAASLVFEEANAAYMTFVTTNGSEAVKFDKGLDINATVQLDSTLTVGVDDTGYDVKFFGDTASAFMLWDASADDLILGGAAGLSVNSTALVTGVLTTTAATVFNGGFTANEVSTISDATSFSAGLTIANTADTHGSVIDFFNNSSSPADNDYIGGLIFKETHSGGGTHSFSKIFGMALDITDGTEDGALTFETSAGGAATAERMRITTDVLIGTGVVIDAASGTQDGFSFSAGNRADFSRLNNPVLDLRRRGNDGSILDLYKDTANIGAIGVDGGSLAIGGGDVGIGFYQGADALVPYTGVTDLRDAAIDLGLASGGRWKDLYLSGGVLLGGVDAAHKLDDYEEGSWTPIFGATDFVPGSGGGETSIAYAQQAGLYTKVGDTVFITCNMRTNGRSGTQRSILTVDGLPFTVNNTAGGAMAVSFAFNFPSAAPLAAIAQQNTTHLLLYTNETANTHLTTSNIVASGSSVFNFSGFYRI